MRIELRCIPCLFDDINGALEVLGATAAQKQRVLEQCIRHLARHIDILEPPSYSITAFHRILKEELGIAEPFMDLRAACNSAGTVIAGRVMADAQKLEGFERFKFLVRWAIAGNYLDFRVVGAGYTIDAGAIEKTLRTRFEYDLSIDDTEHIYHAIQQARHIVYIPDNVGELAFDRLLIHELADATGKRITVPMRSAPMTSDATLDDARTLALAHHGVSIINSGPDTLGISFTELSLEARNAFADADLIIAKGQANYYVFSEYGAQYPAATIVSLFTTKCECVAEHWNLPRHSSIATILQAPLGAHTL